MRYLILLIICYLFAVSVGYAQSQTCNGSLGDPIVNIDFSNSNPIPNLTNYTYTSGTPNDGYYTITKSTAGMFDWWAATDHTGNGYMMVVNANVSKTNYFFQQKITGLCPGTTYEFAAWLLNMAKTVKTATPNITFQITDALGNQTLINTGDLPPSISAKDWKQYGILFTTPAVGGDITLTMINNGAGGTGNDIAVDDITFRPCGPVISSSFPVLSSQNASGCAGTAQSYKMIAQIPAGGYPNPMYQWQVNSNGTWTDITGATTTDYTANFTAVTAVAGTYQYRMASANGGNITSPTCRVVSNVLTLTISDIPSVSAPPSVSVCEGQPFSLTLRSGSDPNNTYTWTRSKGGYSSSSANLSIPNVQLSDDDTYTVTVKNAAGCTATASTILKVSPKVTASVSNANFTICEGDKAQLSASGGTTYSWSPAVGLDNPNIANPQANPTKTTTYTVTVSNATACSATAQVTVNVTNKPQISAGADQKMTEGQTITLNGSVDANATSYYWTPSTGLSDPNALRPTARPTEDITYTLHATSGAPCYFETTADVFIRVYKKVVVPNTFTPNGDGINDTWNIVALETYPESYTQVFNRLGRVVYQTHGYAKQWDGSTGGVPLPEGVYYYKIDLKPGTVLSGWVAIVR
ncbi:gliding motility-associated C-terminal domain-containing protein [Mucilaginibacter mali]|uniref:Gliding motility-associated C-terminal domain-containing protein n=1 Tax=Mucilaginibacter mali TaxID=2740462 RepID=A0A7D4TYD4_9SPHI|nr:gliding motility-associated C-terminal domain-containing protein [Mucilaginibacter mali]QKJ31277.1 gliding motility-associated C-terminal domain-containing protein [Mucilaginibacter mali]